jgi:hypothetical protein
MDVPVSRQGQATDQDREGAVVGMAVTTEIASENAFLVGLDLHVQGLANDAAEMWRTGQISKDAFHKLITDYTHLRAEIRFRGRDIKKCQTTTET